jgi:hypothetical protein
MLAIALVLEDWSREAAAEACAMDRQTLRVSDLPRRNGPRPRLSGEQRAKVAEWVEQGPEFARDGMVRWRCVDLRLRIAREFAVRGSRGMRDGSPDAARPGAPL